MDNEDNDREKIRQAFIDENREFIDKCCVLAKHVPFGCYFLKRPDGSWDLTPISQSAAEDFLIDQKLLPDRKKSGWSPLRKGPTVVIHAFDPKTGAPELGTLGAYCHAVYGLDTAPGEGFYPKRNGLSILNTWVRPTLAPKAGAWPRVQRVIDWLVQGDPAAYAYVLNWIAAKVQRPGKLPGSGLILQGSPGSGKNTLYRILAEILGPDNCAVIVESDLSRPFNTHYATKLLLLANELVDVSRRGARLNEQLNSLVTDSQVWLETKGEQRRPATNRAGYILATNSDRPIELAPNDRRWSVFKNFELLTEGKGLVHASFLKSLNVEGDNDKFTPDFTEEIAAFANDMLQRTVDFNALKAPFDNDARRELIEVTESPVDQFLRELRETDDVPKELAKWFNKSSTFDDPVSAAADLWLDGQTGKGAKTKCIYRAFRAFCKDSGLEQRFIPTERTLTRALGSPSSGWEPYKNSKCRGWILPATPRTPPSVSTAPTPSLKNGTLLQPQGQA